MMALLRYWPPFAHLALLAVCAAVAFWRLGALPGAMSGPADPPAAAEPAPQAQGAARAPAVETRPADAETVGARPLFRPGRQPSPVAEAPAPAAGAGQAPAAIRMVGFIDDEGVRSAILETVEDGRSHVVREGDQIAGMTVRQISSTAVVLDAGAAQTTVNLFDD